MAEAVIVGADTYAAIDYGTLSFKNRPRDDRFTNFEYHKFGPVSSLTNATGMQFHLPALMGTVAYALQ